LLPYAASRRAAFRPTAATVAASPWTAGVSGGNDRPGDAIGNDALAHDVALAFVAANDDAPSSEVAPVGLETALDAAVDAAIETILVSTLQAETE
jgi:hypothetical protein